MTKILQGMLFVAMVAPMVVAYMYGAFFGLAIAVCTLGAGLIVVIPAGLIGVWMFKHLYEGVKFVILDKPSKEFIGFFYSVGVLIGVYILFTPGSYGFDYSRLFPWVLASIAGGLYGITVKNAQGQLEPAPQALVQYIQQASTAGAKKTEIVQSLKANGWSDDDVTTAYKALNVSKSSVVYSSVG